jgi:hypothetical protein
MMSNLGKGEQGTQGTQDVCMYDMTRKQENFIRYA